LFDCSVFQCAIAAATSTTGMHIDSAGAVTIY